MRNVLSNFLMLAFVGLFAFCANGQNVIKNYVNNKKAKYSTSQYAIFESTAKRSSAIKDLKNYTTFELNRDAIKSMRKNQSDFIHLEIPAYNKQTLGADLYKAEVLKEDYIIEQPTGKKVFVDKGLHYRGILSDGSDRMVVISIYKDDIIGIVYGYDGGNLVLGRLKNEAGFVSYNDKDIAEDYDLDCGTEDDGLGYTQEELANVTTKALSDCVRLYIEVNYDIYQDKGSTQATTNFTTGMMNQVMALYSNENINTSLMPLYIWTSSSPYTASTTSALLGQFQNHRTSWDGDLAGLLSYRSSGGIAAGFSGICNSNRANSMCYSSIANTYNTVPSYSWSVDVVTHEFGHIFGSRHTHACVWNGNNTAIDGCAGYIEGSCAIPGNPSGGGTIMSYCHTQSVGKNFNLGFGTQPGNVIRNRVANASCLSACSGGGDGGGGGNDCSDNAVTLQLTTDNYASETSWNIKNSSGTTVASGNGYSNATTYTIENCLADGCYTFNILDSYGDGICCSYGSGSYTITYNGTTLASGGSFASSETKNFCVGNSGGGDTQAPSTPTNLTASGTTTTTTTLSWNASTDNVAVTEYKIYRNGTLIGSVTGTSANITNLSPNTNYSFTVRAADEAGNLSANSNAVSVTTLSESNPPANYCTLSANNANYEWIDYVALGGMTNTTGSNGGYGDFTSKVANVTYGSNTIYFSAGYSSTVYNENWRIFIDYNQDGDFADSGELIVSGSSSSAGTYSGTFTIPSSALSGSTRMRVAMKYSTTSNASCGSYTYGEVEDYTVTIGSNMTGITNTDISDASPLDKEAIALYEVYPNPTTTGVINVQKGTSNDVNYTLTNLLGQNVLQGTLLGRNTVIDVTNIEQGVYVLNLNDGQKNVAHKVLIE